MAVATARSEWWWLWLSLAFGAVALLYNAFTVSACSLQGLLTIFLAVYLPSYLDTAHLRDGRAWEWMQRHPLWHRLNSYCSGEINVEEPLKDEKQYIFCQFPHGAYSAAHVLTFTDTAGFITKVYGGSKRDLAASVLFTIPFVREGLSLLGCVDASKPTAEYNLRKGRSLLIFVGGEKEQLMTRRHEHKVVVKSRQGFVRLALEHGVDLVPMYVFGENECYHLSTFMQGPREWLVKNFRVGLPFAWGPLYFLCPFWPLRQKLVVEIGKPIKVPKTENPTPEQVDELHSTFIKELQRLFDRTKAKNGYPDAKLEIF